MTTTPASIQTIGTKASQLSLMRAAALMRVIGTHADEVLQPMAKLLTALHYQDQYYRDLDD